MNYKGEFGAVLEENYLKDDTIHSVKIENEQELSKDELAFLRAYAVKNYLSNEIDALKSTNNYFQYIVINKEKLSTKNIWIKIEFIIKNAFDAFD